MCVEVSPADIRTPTHWYVIGRSTTAPLLVLSPSSILLPLRLTMLSSSQGNTRPALRRRNYFFLIV